MKYSKLLIRDFVRFASFFLMFFSTICLTVITGNAEEKVLVFNDTTIQVKFDIKTNTIELLSNDNIFKDKLGRNIIIQDFEFEKKSGKYIINAQMTLDKGQSTSFTLDKACKGLIGNTTKVKHARTPGFSKGSLDLKQVGNLFIFSISDGHVNLGVSFDMDDALTGDLENRMFFDYFTKGTNVRAVSNIKLNIADCK